MPHSIARIDELLARELRSQPVGPTSTGSDGRKARTEAFPVKAARIWVNGDELDGGNDASAFPLSHTSEIYD
jgi:hypothetical protein